MGQNSESGSKARLSKWDVSKAIGGWISLAAIVLGGIAYLLNEQEEDFKQGDEGVLESCNQRIDELTEEVERLRKGVILAIHYQPDTMPQFSTDKPLTGSPLIQIQSALCDVANDGIDPNTLVCPENARLISREDILERLIPEESTGK